MLAGGTIFPAELKAGNLGIAHFAFVIRAGREVLHKRIGQRGAGLAVEDVRLDLFPTLQGEGTSPR